MARCCDAMSLHLMRIRNTVERDFNILIIYYDIVRYFTNRRIKRNSLITVRRPKDIIDKWRHNIEIKSLHPLGNWALLD